MTGEGREEKNAAMEAWQQESSDKSAVIKFYQ